jgi:protein-S-isoprenylcysteine O-methyltransferase Ste14
MNALLILEVANISVIGFAVLAIFLSIIINFSEADGKAKKEKKSIVETGSMTLFFILFYLVIRFKLGIFENNNLPLRIILMILGWIVIMIGVYFNVAGRFKLGKNWANQVKIYKKQTLVQQGVYSVVRHPLYASLIWMFYAASVIYLNWLAFLMNTLIFIPFMYYRAKQEEKFLSEEFKSYTNYKKKVGMFFPRCLTNGR